MNQKLLASVLSLVFSVGVSLPLMVKADDNQPALTPNGSQPIQGSLEKNSPKAFGLAKDLSLKPPSLKEIGRNSVDSSGDTGALSTLALLSPIEASAEAPQDPEKALLSTEYQINTGKSPIYITIRKYWENGTSGVYINNQEVVKFRATILGQTPLQRAGDTAAKLYQFLREGGNPRDIKPGLEQGKAVLRAGQETVALIDGKTAEAAKASDKQLALLWANNARKALGVDLIAREGRLPVSRGLISHLQDTDLGGELPSPSELLPKLPRYRATGKSQSGIASWYGPGFNGRRASDGSRFNMLALTAAHKYLPFGTRVRVYNHQNGRSCVVKITDRGPFIAGRIIDLSKAAAQQIGMSGVSKVTIEVLAPEVTDSETD